MGNNVVFKAHGMQFKNGCLLIPASPSDKLILNSFCESAANRVITVNARFSKSMKSYDQCKTIFALINIYFYLRTGRYPTSTEQALTYSRLLWKYAPRTADPTSPDESIPIPLSEQTKEEAAIFINSIMGEIYEHQHGLTESMEIDLKNIFEEFYGEYGHGDASPIDYDELGNMLSEAEWRKKNNMSFASFVSTPDLQLHHILSRGAHRAFKDCSWNWIMLTNWEHNIAYHQKGWEYFLDMFPHCARRIKNAFDKGGELYPLDLQRALKKLNLIDEVGNNIQPSFDNMEEVTDLASQALNIGGSND